MRRWYAPVKESDETLLALQQSLRQVCEDSIESVLDYPVLKAKTVHELRKELHNKIILEIYSAKHNKVVGFHMAFWSRLNVHLGLVMISKAAQGKGLQKMALFNLAMLIFDWFAYRFRITDIGYSSSAFRLFSVCINKCYPNLYYDVKPEKWHYDIAKELLDNHRRDMGISAEATFDPVHFVVKGSNKASGGGANALVKHVTTRKSRMGIAAQYLDDLLQPEDEQLYIGDGNLFVFLYRFLPQVSMIGTYLRYIIIFSIFFVHNTLYANASWYAPVVLKLMRFRHHIRGQLPDPKQPALWVCNHFSYLDALLIHAAVPGVRIIAKKDLADEMPRGVFRDFMLKVWTRGGFMWYDRENKDNTIRDRVAAALKSGQSVVVFSEGTSKRSGPPGPMRAGAIAIANANKVPIIPVALRYLCVCVGGGEGGKREVEGGREREREKVCVCMCGCVCGRREVERERVCVCVCMWVWVLAFHFPHMRPLAISLLHCHLCRYSFPIGVAKGDNAIRNIMALLPMRGIRCGIRFAPAIHDAQDIDVVREKVTDLWRELASDMVYPVHDSCPFPIPQETA